jgi:hypothetical protein
VLDACHAINHADEPCDDRFETLAALSQAKHLDRCLADMNAKPQLLVLTLREKDILRKVLQGSRTSKLRSRSTSLSNGQVPPAARVQQVALAWPNTAALELTVAAMKRPQ